MTALIFMVVLASSEVAPIFADHCIQCHHVGGMAPFSVETFEQARPWAKSIARAVATKQMPPFGADGPIGMYVDDPRLTDAEIDVVLAWTRRPRRYEAVEYVERETVDTEHALTAVVDVPGDGRDILEQAVVVNHLARPVKASAVVWETEGPAIHHASVHGIPMSRYLPGSRVSYIPKGYAVTVRPEDALTAGIHIGPEWITGKSTATIKLVEAGPDSVELPEPFLINFRYDSPGLPFIIPADSVYVRDAKRTTDVDMMIRAVTVHMHALGKSAELLDESGEVLFSVSKYSTDWQLTYVLADPIFVDRGTELTARHTWDNTKENSRPVGYGTDADKEMGWLEIVWTSVRD